MRAATKKKPKALRVKKLSSLLAIGLRDLRKQERAKKSVVNMGEWYRCNGKCTACLAGSVLRFSMGLGRKKGDLLTHSSKLTSRIHDQLDALDALRRGCIELARQKMGCDGSVMDRFLPLYDGSDGQWWTAMKQLHADLIASGE